MVGSAHPHVNTCSNASLSLVTEWGTLPRNARKQPKVYRGALSVWSFV
jgi:hypothetical protein